MIAMLIMIWIFFFVLTGGVFMRPRNLSNLLIQLVHIGILANGMVLVIVTGGLDLSVGSSCTALGALAGWFMVRHGLNPVFAVIITLFAGFVLGCWHGFWIAFRRVPAVIVTFASMIAFRGISSIIAGGSSFGDFKPGFKAIGQAFIPQIYLVENTFLSTTVILSLVAAVVFIIVELHTRKKRIANGLPVLKTPLAVAKVLFISAVIIWFGSQFSSYLGIPVAVIILLAVTGIFAALTSRTPFGRHVYAIGDNIEAARLSGVNIKSTMMRIYILMGILSAVAALVYIARANLASSYGAGNIFEMDAIAACIIGGVSTTGGIGSVFGAVVGALVIASLDNGLSLMNVPTMYQLVIKGFVLLLAVWMDIVNRKK